MFTALAVTHKWLNKTGKRINVDTQKLKVRKGECVPLNAIYGTDFFDPHHKETKRQREGSTLDFSTLNHLDQLRRKKFV